MKQWLRDKASELVVMLVVSGIGGGVGMFVGYKLLEQRVAAVEARQAEDRARVNGMADQLSSVGRDVSYIRGVLEGRTGKP